VAGAAGVEAIFWQFFGGFTSVQKKQISVDTPWAKV
jgi:hypothetical protein